MISFSLLLFTLGYLFICNYFQILTFLHALSKPKHIEFISDPQISDIIQKKTGLKIKRITIFESKTFFGMMPAIPWKPEMILSSALYQKLNKDELEWVVLHEAAHCKFWHVVKSALTQFILLILGVFILYRFALPFIITILLTPLFACMAIQCMRYFEREADTFAISNVDNPYAVITAQKKFESQRPLNSEWIYGETSIIRKILFWNILPSERIRLANDRIRAK